MSSIKAELIWCGMGLLAAGSPARAEINKEKLRDAAAIKFDFSVSAGYSAASGYFVRADENADPPTPESILAKRKGNAEDAALYVEVARLFSDTDDPRARMYYKEAETLYRQQAEADPSNAVVKVQRAEALYDSGSESEGEALARQIANDSPRTWQAWTALGAFATRRANKSIFAGAKEKISYTLTDAAAMAALLQRLKPTPEQLGAVNTAYAEAQADYDKAVTVAPEVGEVYAIHAGQRWTTAFFSIFRQSAASKTPLTPEQIQAAMTESLASFFTPESTAEFVQAARHSADDPLALGTGAFMVVLSNAARVQNFNADAPGGLWAKIPKTDQATIRSLMARLQTLENGTDTAQAAQAAKMRGLVTLLAEGRDKALPSLKHAVALAPDDVQASSLLVSTLMMKRQYREAAILLEAQIKTKDTLRRRLMLARAYDGLHNREKAREQMQAALRLDPQSYTTNLAFAAHLLRNADTDIALQEAGEQLTKTANVYPSNADSSQSGDYHLLRGIYMGLTNRFSEARKELSDLRETDKDNKDVQEALSALGE